MTYQEAKKLKKGDIVKCKITKNILTVHSIVTKTDKRVEIETKDEDNMYETYFHNKLILIEQK